jgi:hypothetical protein
MIIKHILRKNNHLDKKRGILERLPQVKKIKRRMFKFKTRKLKKAA